MNCAGKTIGNYIAYTNYSALSTTYTKEHGPQPVNSLAAVRVSFDVVPTNGAPKSTIVKTFFANIVSSGLPFLPYAYHE